jgi:hypothetical protein
VQFAAVSNNNPRILEGVAMEPALMMRWELLCAAAITCFSFSGALIMQMPKEERRTLFIFPIFLSVTVGGSLTVFGYDKFGAWIVAGPVLAPIVLVYLVRRTMAPWILTMMSYVTLMIAVIFADLLLEASTAFR